MPRTRMREVYSAALTAASYFGSTLPGAPAFRVRCEGWDSSGIVTSTKVPALSLQKPEGQGRGTLGSEINSSAAFVPLLIRVPGDRRHRPGEKKVFECGSRSGRKPIRRR